MVSFYLKKGFPKTLFHFRSERGFGKSQSLAHYLYHCKNMSKCVYVISHLKEMYIAIFSPKITPGLFKQSLT